MPRTARASRGGFVYHVINRGNNRNTVFRKVEDYVAFARARGLSERKVIGGYAFRNALIPILTAGGLLFLGLLTGSVLVETVFGLPGLGNMLVTAVKASDFPVIQGLILVIAAWIILVNIVVDILYAVIDPRVGFEKALG